MLKDLKVTAPPVNGMLAVTFIFPTLVVYFLLKNTTKSTNVFHCIFWIDEIPELPDLSEPMQRRLEVKLWPWLALVPLQLALFY